MAYGREKSRVKGMIPCGYGASGDYSKDLARYRFIFFAFHLHLLRMPCFSYAFWCGLGGPDQKHDVQFHKK